MISTVIYLCQISKLKSRKSLRNRVTQSLYSNLVATQAKTRIQIEICHFIWRAEVVVSLLADEFNKTKSYLSYMITFHVCLKSVKNMGSFGNI